MNFEDCVIKRNGEKEVFSFDKIYKRILTLGKNNQGVNELNVKYTTLAQKIIDRLYDGIPTEQIDELTAQQCASLITTHPDYGILASRILVSNHHKNTDEKYIDVVSKLYNFKDIHGEQSSLVNKELFDVVQSRSEEIQQMFDFDRDYLLDYFGFKTLERAYLQRINGTIVERPQHMWMRVSLAIHGENMEKVKETYELMSQKYFTHATPTLFNAGTPRQQMSSCYLLSMKDDSIAGIYETLSDCAKISKWAGGIGLHIHNVRAAGSHIRGTNGISNGIVPMLRVFNNTARYVDQGGGKRNGSFAIYLEPWHKDIREFLEMRKTHGDEEQRARDLFYGLWIPDLFMERVSKGGEWTLMCPDQCPGLSDVYGDDFKQLYNRYEKEGRGEKVKARDIWFKILDSQIETGTPYMLYKDACNKKSNQKNLGTIKSSNLCVAPETLVLTENGHEEIQYLKDKKINVWNGKEFSEVTIKQTSDESELITVNLSDGSELTCTKYHKFYIQNKYPTSGMKQDIIKSKSVTTVEAQNLKNGMKLIKCEYPIIDSKKQLENSYTNGFFSGDGTYTNTGKEVQQCKFKATEGKAYCKRHIDLQRNDETDELCRGLSYSKKNHVSLYGEKIKLLEFLNYRSHGEIKDNKLNVTLTEHIEDKFFVPINYSLKSKLDWLAGYADADGSISRNGTNEALQISSIHKKFLIDVKLMLQTCGISSKVSVNMEKRNTELPDGRGGYKNYSCNKLWRLLIASNELQKLIELGFSPNRLIINNNNPQRNAVHFVKIENITDNNRKDKTFCFTEPKRHAGIFNGVITSQCTEIIEYSDADETAVCNLASIGLPNFVKTRNLNELKSKKITVYSKNGCSYCKLTKLLLNKHQVEFKNMLVEEEHKESFKTKFNEEHNVELKTFPVVLVDDKFIGGYTELLDIMRNEVDHEKLHQVTKVVTKNLNRVIDINFYPTSKTKTSNSRHRPIGLGVQGLADVFMLLDLPFASEGAQKVNREIFETIYHAAVEASMELSKKEGPYSTFKGSPASEGLLSPDLWNKVEYSGRYDWVSLKQLVKSHGIRNSLLVAPMPTASTSQILGNNECFEPYTNNIYVRRTIAGEFVMVNRHLLKELVELGYWTETIKTQIIAANGSIQKIKDIPKCIKEKYKVVWEIPMKHLINMAAARAPFIDQSMSMNLWMQNPTYDKLTAMHFYSFKQGLKTGLYYLRTKAKAAPQQFTVDPTAVTSTEDDEEGCVMCSA